MATSTTSYAIPTTVKLEWVMPSFLTKLREKGTLLMEFAYSPMYHDGRGNGLPTSNFAKDRVQFRFTLRDNRIDGGIACFHECHICEVSQTPCIGVVEDEVDMTFSICGTPDITCSKRLDGFQSSIPIQESLFTVFTNVTVNQLNDPTKGYICGEQGVKFRCTLRSKRVFNHKVPTKISSISQQFNHRPIMDVARGIEAAYKSRQYLKDVTLEAGDGTKIETSKFMLAARSEVFLAMFQHDTLEELSNHVIIPDTDGETLAHFVEFVFTGIFPRSAEIAIGLITMADKYLMKLLKDYCTTTLMSQLKSENVLEIMAVAEQCGIDCLKQAAFEYICTSAKQLTSLPSWGKVRDERPALLDELCNYMQHYKRPGTTVQPVPTTTRNMPSTATFIPGY